MPNSLKSAFSRRTHPRVDISFMSKICGALGLALLLLALLYPSVLADVSDTVVAPQRVFTGLRWGLAALGLFVLSQRRLHWWEPLALLCASAGLLGNYAQNLTLRQPLSLSDLALRLALAMFIIRMLFRPTPAEDSDSARKSEKENKALREENERLKRLLGEQ